MLGIAMLEGQFAAELDRTLAELRSKIQDLHARELDACRHDMQHFHVGLDSATPLAPVVPSALERPISPMASQTVQLLSSPRKRRTSFTKAQDIALTLDFKEDSEEDHRDDIGNLFQGGSEAVLNGFEARSVWTRRKRNSTPTNGVSTKSITPSVIRRQARIRSELARTASNVKRGILWPTSSRRCLWCLVALLVFGYDLLAVPVRVAFELEDTFRMRIVDWVVLAFWVADIPATFLAGAYVENTVTVAPGVVACLYVKTYLSLDVLLCAMDLAVLLIGTLDRTPDGASEPLVVRVARPLRLVNLLRALKVAKVHFEPLHQRLYIRGHVYGMLQPLLALVFGLHFLACAWYCVAKLDGGYVHTSGLVSAELGERYAMALYWSVAELQGSTTHSPTSTTERLFETCIMLASFLGASLFLAWVIRFVGSLGQGATHKVGMKRAFLMYVRSHTISPGLSRRVKDYMASYSKKQRLLEECRDVQILLDMLPDAIQTDLHQESRSAVIYCLQFFCDLQMLVPQVVRNLCHRAIGEVIVGPGEVVFDLGYSSDRTWFVGSGSLQYVRGGSLPYCIADDEEPPFQQAASLLTIRSNVSRKNSLNMIWYNHVNTRSLGFLNSQVVVRGHCLAEPAVWTEWLHCGQLRAREASMLLALNAHTFGEVMEEYDEAKLFAVLYCRLFLFRLNIAWHECPADKSDLMMLYHSDDDLYAFNEFDADHYLFLSHYKSEAGAVAALMAEGLERMIHDELPLIAAKVKEAPVFLDSDTLKNLCEVQDHVQKSHCVILLLTPNVLSRAWCLYELVMARRTERFVVPVDVQTASGSFEYPDKVFFTRLAQGEALSEDTVEFLHQQGIELAEVSSALRHTFSHIALPFSPHKSARVRQAELGDILRRCAALSEGLREGLHE